MKVGAPSRVRPVQSVSTVAGGGGGISGTGESGLFPPSGSIPTASGSNQWAWGSNVAIITSNSSNQLLGPFVNFASGTGIAFAAASNTLTISNTGSGGGGGGGAAVDPTIPSGGTLYDGTTTSGWTTFGSPDTFDVTTISGHFYLQETTFGTNNLIGVYRAVGSFPKTYTMKIGGGFLQADFHGINLIVGEAAPGKFWSWGVVRDGANTYSQRYAWTTASSSGTNANFGSGREVNLPAWYRIVVNSSTDIELWQSHTGLPNTYYRFASAQNPAFTIGVFGFAMYTFSAIEMRAAIDWIHES